MWEIMRVFDGAHSVRQDGVEREVIRARRGSPSIGGGIEPLTDPQRVELERVFNSIGLVMLDEEDSRG